MDVTKTVEFCNAYSALSVLLDTLPGDEPMRVVVKNWLTAMAGLVVASAPAIAV